MRTQRLKSFVLSWIVPEHSVSSVLTLSVKESKGSLKDNIIFALRLTLVALSAGSTETSSGTLSEAVSDFSTGTTTVPPHPNKKKVSLNKTKSVEAEKLKRKFKKLDISLLVLRKLMWFLTMRFYCKLVNDCS